MTENNFNAKKHNMLFLKSVIVILVIFSINLFGVGKYVLALLAPLALYVLIKQQVSKLFLITLLSLVFFSITYGITILLHGLVDLESFVVRVMYPNLALILGYFVGLKLNKTIELNYLLIFLMLSPALYGILSFWGTLQTFGSIEAMRIGLNGRIVLDYWDGYIVSATLINAYLSLSLVLLPLIISNGSDLVINLKVKIAVIFSYIASVFVALTMGNRTAVVIIVFSLFITISYELFLLKDKKMSILIRIIFVSLLGFFMYYFNIYSIQDTIKKSSIANRLETSALGEDPRIYTWRIVLENIFLSPFGGKEVELSVGYAHNLWLDIGYEAGVLPLLIFLIFSIISIYTLILLLKNYPYFNTGKIILLIFIAFFMTFTVEPILQGLIVYFSLFAFLVGVMQAVILKKDSAKQKTIGKAES